MHYCLDVKDIKKFPVAIRSGETPVPIPNTTVKTRAAESTILATVWEDRWLPDKKESKGSDIDHRMERLPSIDDCLSSQKAKQISSISTKHLLLERKNLIHCTLKTEY